MNPITPSFIAILLNLLLLFSPSDCVTQTKLFKQVSQPKYIQELDSATKQYLDSGRPDKRAWTLHQLLVKQLRKSEVDTVLYYQAGCVGCEDLPDRDAAGKTDKPCACAEDESTVYLFWQKKGKILSKQLDCCRNFPVTKANPAVINFYFQNKKHFQSGVQFYRDFEAYNLKHPKAVKFLPPFEVHDGVQQILFYVKQDTLQFQVRDNDFTKAGKPKYLQYTWKQKQWQWARLIAKAVQPR